MESKYKKGEHIRTLDELARQEFVYFGDKVTHRGWFESWQLRFAKRWLGENGRIFYAERINPDKIVCNKCGRRFTDESELKRLIEISVDDNVVVLDYKYNQKRAELPNAEVIKGCPHCRTDAYLMDLEAK